MPEQMERPTRQITEDHSQSHDPAVTLLQSTGLPASPKRGKRQSLPRFQGRLVDDDFKVDHSGKKLPHDEESPTWVPRVQHGERPRPTTSHCQIAVDGFIYHFGGTIDDDIGGSMSDKLYKYDIEKSRWSEIAAKGDTPTQRVNACMATAAGSIYMFGGYGLPKREHDGPYHRLGDLWCFHTDSEQWERLTPTGAAPSPRTGHTLVAFEEKLVIFGGYGKDCCGNQKVHTLNDVHILDLVRLEWSTPKTGGDTGRYQLIPRHSHSATVVGNKMVVFGGYSDQHDTRGRTHDVNILNLDTYTWNRPETIGDGVVGRSGHSAVLHDHTIFFFGGMIAPDKSDEAEAEILAAKEKTEKKGKLLWNKANKGYKYKLAADNKANSFKNLIDLAHAENSFLMNEIDVLDVETLRWFFFQASGTMVGRMGHGAVMANDRMIVTGGTDGSGARSDMVELLIA